MNQPNTTSSGFSAGQTSSPTPAKAAGGGCLKGCLITFGILAIIAFAASYWAVKNLGNIARQAGSTAIDHLSEEFLKDAKLDSAQKAKVTAVVKDFTARIRSGEVGVQQGAEILQSLVKGPLIPNIVAGSFEAIFLNSSSLSPAEIQASRVSINRFMQGVIQERIAKAHADEIFDLFSSRADSSDTGKRTFKAHLTDEEVRSVVAKMKLAADSAQIQPSVPEIDIADELQRAIDKGLGK